MNIEAFFQITYGLYIISSEYEGKKNGYIGNTVFQVTANPPQLAISCSKDNFSAAIIEKSGLFSVSVLHTEVSKNLIGTFGYKSGKNTDKFKDVKFIAGNNGIPIVTDGSLAWFECKVVKKIDVGTHIIFIGEVLNSEILQSGQPITYAYFRENRKGAAPKNAPTYIDKSKLVKDKEETGKKEKPENTKSLKWECTVCGHIYDPEEGDPDSGIPPGTPFEELPDNWVCPDCGAEKSEFIPLDK